MEHIFSSSLFFFNFHCKRTNCVNFFSLFFESISNFYIKSGILTEKIQLTLEYSFFGLNSFNFTFCLKWRGNRHKLHITFIYFIIFSTRLKLNFDFCLVWECIWVYASTHLLEHFRLVRGNCTNNCWFNQCFRMCVKQSPELWKRFEQISISASIASVFE